MAFPDKPISLTAIDAMLLKVYVRLVISFRTSSTFPQAGMTEILQKALSLTVAEFPAMGGKVSQRDEKGNLQVHDFQEVNLVVKNLPEFASYDELASKNMPIDLLSADSLCPVGQIPDSDARATYAQVNYIKGGSLLCFCYHHNVFDGLGSANIIKVWSTYCKILTDKPNHSPQTHLSSAAATNNGRLIKSSPSHDIQSHPELSIGIPADAAAVEMPSVGMQVKTFVLTPEGQDRLKSTVSSTIAGGTISSHDILCALLWTSVSRARRIHLEPKLSSETISKLGIAVDGRRRMTPPLPDDYPYNLGLYNIVALPLSELYKPSTEQIGQIALGIRESINKVDDEYIKSYIGFINNQPDITKIQPNWSPFLGKDYTITSWTTSGLYEYDWGTIVGGKPEFVRLPAGAFDGVCILLPRRVNGSLEIIVGLREDDMGRLLEDEQFGKYIEVFAG